MVGLRRSVGRTWGDSRLACLTARVCPAVGLGGGDPAHPFLGVGPFRWGLTALASHLWKNRASSRSGAAVRYFIERLFGGTAQGPLHTLESYVKSQIK